MEEKKSKAWRKNNTGEIVLITIVIALLLISLPIIRIASEKKQEKVSKIIYSLAEKSYMEGQIDYSNGDIRIEKQGEDYIWIKSPWDGDREPVYKNKNSYSSEVRLNVKVF